jgi:hypothetical protein
MNPQNLEEKIKKKEAEVDEASNKVKEFVGKTEGKNLDDPLWKSLEEWKEIKKELKEELEKLQQQRPCKYFYFVFLNHTHYTFKNIVCNNNYKQH